MGSRPKPVVLIVLDGWGIAPAWGGNAIGSAKTPNFDKFWAKYPRTTLNASGQFVGLPGYEMGNSEVGHLNIGGGRVVPQDSSLIFNTIRDGSFYKNPTFLEAINYTKRNNSTLHIMGLVSNGGVHSHIEHLFSLLDLARSQGLRKLFVHAFTDGRDAAPMSALSYISKLEEKLKQLSIGKIASISGRYWAMDRDNRWERTERCWRAIAEGVGERATSAMKAISFSYSQGNMDEFIPPTVIVENNMPIAQVSDNDALIFFNFRADRARQLTRAFTSPDFKEFPRKKVIKNLYFVAMVPYYEYELKIPIHIAFETKELRNTLAEVLSKTGLKQLHIAESEKYAHVTYFFNGVKEEPFPGEDRILIPSPKVKTYDLKPEMSAEEITAKTCGNLSSYDFILVNFANADMVGHTGKMQATIKAVETVDTCFGKIVEDTEKLKGLVVICADHGNADSMIDPKTGEEDTEHSTAQVPFIVIDNTRKFQALHSGSLCNIAPTILDIMGINKPAEMTGLSLFGVSEKTADTSFPLGP